ncbi:MAG: HAMP domain-containing histidine kinase, partial [Comamonadaceae bacterium]
MAIATQGPPLAAARTARTDPDAGPAATAALRTELVRALVQQHSRMLLQMPWIHALLVGIFAFGLLPDAPVAHVGGWALLVLSNEVCRATYGASVLRRIARIDTASTHRMQMVLAAWSGASVGALVPLFVARLTSGEQALAMFIVVACPALGVAVSAASRHIAFSYAVAVLVPANAGWLEIHPDQVRVATLASVVYVLVLVLAAIETERTLLHAVSIRRERDEVVRALELSNAEVHKAVARAERESAARARVLAAASHDMRQPLHALSIYSAVLAASPTPEKLQEVGAHIDRLVRSLGELLHGLLDLARLSNGQYLFEPAPFDLQQLVLHVGAEFEATAAAKGLALACTAAPATLDGDAVAVARITRNLLDNAIKYTHRGGVSLALTTVPGGALLSISDTGIGIASDDQGHIFEEFYQTGNPQRDRLQGVGLGLAIVQRLVDLTRARITLESTPGVGSRFDVFLPGARPTVGATPGRAAVRPTGARGAAALPPGGTVYVVDDDADIRRSMCELLT